MVEKLVPLVSTGSHKIKIAAANCISYGALWNQSTEEETFTASVTSGFHGSDRVQLFFVTYPRLAAMKKLLCSSVLDNANAGAKYFWNASTVINGMKLIAQGRNLS